MSKGVPYAEYQSVYNIACGLEDREGNLLTPDRAISSALRGVLTLDSEKRKKELLGEEAYGRAEELANFLQGGNLEPFLGVCPEAHLTLYSAHNAKRMEELKRIAQNPQKYYKLIAATLRREFFPTTEDFKSAHYLQMDQKMFLA